MNKVIPLLAFSILLLVPVGIQDAFALTIYGPSFYLDFDNSLGASPDISPFSSIDFSSGYFHLEDFQDGLFNTPGVTVPQPLIVSTTAGLDSVDGDDGVLDNVSNPAGSAFSPTQSFGFVRIQFNQGTLGNYPTYVGIVMTDTTFGFGSAQISFIDSNFNTVHTDVYFDPVPINDAVSTNPSGHQDLFYGVHAPQGISSIAISGPSATGSFEFDHVQYGFIPPEQNNELIIGGEIIPIEQTSLILAGAQSFSWMIPVLLSGIGIGLFVVSRRSE